MDTLHVIFLLSIYVTLRKKRNLSVIFKQSILTLIKLIIGDGMLEKDIPHQTI